MQIRAGQHILTAEDPLPPDLRVTYTGSGYANGYREGQRADIGRARLRAGSKALGAS